MPQPSQNPPAGRAEVLAAATDLFGESGYDAVSISAIAQRAGTSKANVFHHFGSKDALYLEVMRVACSQFADAVDRLGAPGTDFAERLRAFLRRDVELMHEWPDRAHLVLREVLESGPSRGQALAGEVFHDHFVELVALIEEGQRSGAVTRDVPAGLAATMMIACNVFLFQSQHVLRYLPGIDFVDDPPRYAGLVSRVLLDGLRPQETGAQAPSSGGSDT